MYIFRADGNARIGAGHIMRTMTIADALLESEVDNRDILFVCAELESANVVKKRGFKATVLDSDYMDMDSEISKWDNFVPEAEGHIILVDSYYVTDTYLQSLGKYGIVIYMDDLRDHIYPVNGIINYNAYAKPDEYNQRYSDEIIKLIGPAYMPIRPQFTGREYIVSDEVRNVLITTGGGDKDNIAGRILDAVNNDRNIHFHVISGQFNRHLASLEKQAMEMGNVSIHRHVENMADLMLDCDIAITAGGGTMNELCALGVPFICFTYADNQEPGAEYMDSHSIADYAGAYHRNDTVTLKQISEMFNQNIHNFDYRKSHSDNGRGIIDGCGAKRIAQMLRNCK